MMGISRIVRRASRRMVLLVVSCICVVAMYISLQVIMEDESTELNGAKKFSGRAHSKDETEYVDEVPVRCKRPHMELWHRSMQRHFATPAPLNCADAPHNWVRVDNGTFVISESANKLHGKIMCEYRPIVRINDDVENLGDPIRPFHNGTKITSDFFEARCLSYKGEVHKNLHSSIKPLDDILQRSKTSSLPKTAMGMNVLMFGFDSVSRLNWMRNLPKSHEYLTKELGGVTLEGYNIVGDGTPQALLPILTGMTEEELPEARRGFVDARHVDSHPWIWKDFSDAGYVTQWGEDGALVGTFNYRMLGFNRPPVDHYLRPFQHMAESKYYQQNYAYCMGSKPRAEVMFDWIKAFFDAYPSVPKFSFLFHSEFSHDAFSKLSLADDHLKQFLMDMKSSGYLNNTVLILMSDHGARFVDVRLSQQGKFEERLPYMSIRMPEWFQHKYPRAMENLRNNVKVLTTPFDIHETFNDILNYSAKDLSEHPSRGISLFQPISENRTCKMASIAPHWCTCLEWLETSFMDKRVIAAASAVVKKINTMTQSHRDACNQLSLDTIDVAMKFSPNEKVLKFKKSADAHGRRADFSDRMQATAELYQVSITTKPGGAKYEATVMLEVFNGVNCTVNSKEISRINRYGKQPHCIMEKLPHLRPYCFCKVQL